MYDEIRGKLAEAENRITALREERSRAAKVKKSAVDAASESETEGSLKGCGGGVTGAPRGRGEDRGREPDPGRFTEAVLGDLEAGRSGFAYPGLDGWSEGSEAARPGDRTDSR